MTAPKPNPYALRLSNWEKWLADPENLKLLKTACVGRCEPDRAAAVMRVLVSKTSAISGTVDQSQKQIATATLLHIDMIKRIIKALKVAGLLIMVAAPRSGGRNGGTGKPTIYQITCLAVVDNPEMGAQKTVMGVQETLNGCAPDCTPLRVRTTELTTEAVSEKTENRSTAKTYTDSNLFETWQIALIERCTDQLVKDTTGSWTPDNPAAYRRTQQRKVSKAATQMQKRWPEIHLITADSYEYSAVCAIATSWALEQNPSVASIDLLNTELDKRVSMKKFLAEMGAQLGELPLLDYDLHIADI